MEEINIELDDEIGDWLESTAEKQEMSISELVGALLRERREACRVMAEKWARKRFALY